MGLDAMFFVFWMLSLKPGFSLSSFILIKRLFSYSSLSAIRVVGVRITCVLSWLSHVQLFGTSWTATCQYPLSMGFSRQEHWNGLPCSPPGDLPDPGIEPTSLMSPALAGGFFTTSTILVSYKLCILRMKTSYSKTNYASKPDHKCKHSGLHQILWSYYLSNMGFG